MICAPCVYKLSSGEPRFPYKLYRVSTTISHPPQSLTTAEKPLPSTTSAELTFGHCSDQPRQSSSFASTAESMMSADTPACSSFINLCLHHSFTQAYPAFERWKWFLQMYFVHFVFLHINAVRCWLLLARMVNQRLVSEKNATTHREGTLELENDQSLFESLVKR